MPSGEQSLVEENRNTGSQDWLPVRPDSPTRHDIDWGLAALFSVILLLSFGMYRMIQIFAGRSVTSSTSQTGAQAAIVVDKPHGPVLRSQPASTAEVHTKFADQLPLARSQERTPDEPYSTSPRQTFPSSAAQPEPNKGMFDTEPKRHSDAMRMTGEDGGQTVGTLLGDHSSQRGPVPQLSFVVKAEQPAAAVDPAVVAKLSTDTTMANYRERAQIASRAASAASEASQRAAAYAAAASSAASKAADAAETAATAATVAVRAAESAADRQLAAAELRIARALEQQADLEARAARDAATAIAYQDISETQASIATAAASMPEKVADQPLPSPAPSPQGQWNQLWSFPSASAIQEAWNDLLHKVSVIIGYVINIPATLWSWLMSTAF